MMTHRNSFFLLCDRKETEPRVRGVFAAKVAEEIRLSAGEKHVRNIPVPEAVLSAAEEDSTGGDC
jgi:hypothetical protein